MGRALDRTRSEPLAACEDAAEHREVERHPGHAELRALLDQGHDHVLDQTVLGVAVPPHQVEGETVVAPRREVEDALRCALGVTGDDHHGPVVARVTEAAQCHAEPALDLSVAPVVGKPAQRGPGGRVDVRGAVAGDDQTGPLAAGHRLPDDTHAAPLERELGEVEHRLVAELERVEPGAVVGHGTLVARAEHRGHPAEGLGLVQPDLDRARPGLRVAERVTGRERHGADDAVGDRRLAAPGEQHRPVAAQREVGERVHGTPAVEQPADPGLLVAVERVRAVGGQQRDQGEGEQHAGAEHDERDRRTVVVGRVDEPHRSGDPDKAEERVLDAVQGRGARCLAVGVHREPGPAQHRGDNRTQDQHRDDPSR